MRNKAFIEGLAGASMLTAYVTSILAVQQVDKHLSKAFGVDDPKPKETTAHRDRIAHKKEEAVNSFTR